MKMLSAYLKNSADVISQIVDDKAINLSMARAIEAIWESLDAGLPLLICGNGGSATDAQHIAAELVGRFLRERRALNAICLSDNPGILTALGNDYGYDKVFSRQVEAYAQTGGVLLAISTSGNSANVVEALKSAKAAGMITIGLTGEGGGKMGSLCDILLAVPSKHTPYIQQAHLCLYHYLCHALEQQLCSTESNNQSIAI
jgi:D-sedoheptulose 7-phosphate isomerase